jgi:D-alanine-D-alanine ligase
VRLGFTFTVRSSGTDSTARHGLAGDAEEEYDSQETVDAIVASLRSLGHEVELLGDGEPLIRRLLNGNRPELVFNLAEGRGIHRSREARVPALLEMLGIPYTGSDPLTLAAALDKPVAKTIVAAAGVTVPRGVVVERVQGAEGPKSQVPSPKSGRSGMGPGTWDLGLNLPLIAKPAFEGSSKGILRKCLIDDRTRLADTVEELLKAYQQPILVEEFIEGDELTVGIVGNDPPQAIGIMRIVPQKEQRNFIYSLEVKRDWQDQVRYECPAKISPADSKAVEQAALAAYKALGCRDVARIDFRLRGGVPYFIEANPLPGLSPTSGDIVILAREMGIEHSELLRRILAAAVERHGSQWRMTKSE